MRRIIMLMYVCCCSALLVSCAYVWLVQSVPKFIAVGLVSRKIKKGCVGVTGQID